jgi:hypothetical protein
MTLEARIIALAQSIGADIKSQRNSITTNTANIATNSTNIATNTSNIGTLGGLSTAAKANIVAALNEIYAISTAAAVINDTALLTNVTNTWSVKKINDTIELAKTAVTNSIVAGAGTALDTLIELGAAINNDPNFAATITSALGNRVRVDAAQSLTTGQQDQARSNINAASETARTTLMTNLGNLDSDFAGAYVTAKT